MKKNSSSTRIQERIQKGFLQIIGLAAFSIFLCVGFLIYISNRYDYTLINYAFAQGDVGKAMTDIADIRSGTRAMIGYNDEEVIAEITKTHEELKGTLSQNLEQVKKTIVTEEGKAMYDKIESSLDKYFEIEEKVISLGTTLDVEKSREAQKIALEELTPAYNEVYDAFSALMDVNIQKGDKEQKNLIILTWILVAVSLCGLVLALSIAHRTGGKIATKIVTSLSALSERLGMLAKGDLHTPFPTFTHKDEITEIVDDAQDMAKRLDDIISDMNYLLSEMAKGNFNIHTKVEASYTNDFQMLLTSIREMNAYMSDSLKQINDSSNQVSMGSENVAESAQALAEGATDQAASVEEMQATINDITNGLENTVTHVEETEKQAKMCVEEADRSREEMKTMVATMGRITETSKQIENIISEIEDIASQTNLLSLNAAIEAARAGEAGKGFAVVADQIRNLAEQSAKSAVGTRELIEGSLHEVAEGNRVVESTATSLEEVVKGIKLIADASEQLSHLTDEQAQAMEQVNIGIERISDVVQSNSATAQESSATSEELSAQALAMTELVGKFQLRD